jgi:DNA-binding GntR family transcriptional regulator
MDKERELKQPDAARAYRALEEAIVTLELAPGSSTTERALIERAGFGRTPVREAIQRLAWEGFLVIRPRLGLAVAPLDAEDWMRVLDARRGVEIVLARSAAGHVTSDTTRAFLEASEAMYAAAAANNDRAFMAADKDWDDAMAAGSNNLYAVRVAAPLQAHSRRFWYKYRRGGGLAQAANKHIAVIEAVLRGDGDAAATATERLIDMLRADAAAVTLPSEAEPA